VEVRPLHSMDATSYYRLRIRSEQEFPQFVGFSAERELAVGAEGMAALLSAYESEGTLVWGAFEEKELVGVLSLSRRLSPKYRHKAFLWGMYVVPGFRGGGVAQGLMEAAVYWARSQPEILAIWLQVTLSNVRGQQFYAKHGFAVFGTEQRSLFAAGEFHGVHYMELQLKAAQQVVQGPTSPPSAGTRP